jgi:hypothetical protein
MTSETTTHAGAIDLELIAEHVRRAGYVAYVEQTGGGCATIYASKTADARGYPVRPDGDHHECAVGPGWFDGPGWTRPRASLSDLVVGLDDDGETEPYVATAADDEASLAAKIIATLSGEVTYELRQPLHVCASCGHDAADHGSFGGITDSGQWTAGCVGADGCPCSYARYMETSA